MNANELVTVIGANGAGKTTLVKAIMGLVPCAEGQIWVDDVDLTPMKAWDRTSHQVCYVPEGARIFPFLSVEENLRMGAFCRECSPTLKISGKCIDCFPFWKREKGRWEER